jgi:hypothetical protein
MDVFNGPSRRRRRLSESLVLGYMLVQPQRRKHGYVGALIVHHQWVRCMQDMRYTPITFDHPEHLSK